LVLTTSLSVALLRNLRDQDQGSLFENVLNESLVT